MLSERCKPLLTQPVRFVVCRGQQEVVFTRGALQSASQFDSHPPSGFAAETRSRLLDQRARTSSVFLAAPLPKAPPAPVVLDTPIDTGYCVWSSQPPNGRQATARVDAAAPGHSGLPSVLRQSHGSACRQRTCATLTDWALGASKELGEKRRESKERK